MRDFESLEPLSYSQPSPESSLLCSSLICISLRFNSCVNFSFRCRKSRNSLNKKRTLYPQNKSYSRSSLIHHTHEIRKMYSAFHWLPQKENKLFLGKINYLITKNTAVVKKKVILPYKNHLT